MGKVDDLRKMREERWASMQKSTSSFQASKRASDIDNDKGAPYQKPDLTGSSKEPQACGHMSISKKTCTRPAGHSEKNHRYT